MLIRHPAHRGMTLIELVIGIAIVGMLMVLGLPSFGTWLQNSQIRTATESIQNGLQLARAEAVQRNTNVQFVLPGTGAAWTVGCVAASATCPAAIQSRAAAEGTTNAAVAATEVVTATGLAAAAPVFTGTLTFNGMGRVVTSGLNPTLTPGNNAIYAVTNPTGGACATATTTGMRCLQVVVSTGGQVRMCDPILSATDPRGC